MSLANGTNLPKAHPVKADLTMVLTKKFGLHVDSGKIVKFYALTNLDGLKLVPRVHVTDTDYVESGNEIGKDSCGFPIGTLSKDVFERRTSTGSEAFSLFICLDANKLVLLSFFSLLKTIYPRVSTKPFPSDAKSPLPVDVRRSKTLLLKLPNNILYVSAWRKEMREPWERRR